MRRWKRIDSDLLEQFSRVLSVSHLDATVLSELENHTTSYWKHRLQAVLPSSVLLEDARAHFSFLIRLLQGSLSFPERQRICALGSETAQVIGMLLFDLRCYSLARQHFHVAIRAAQEANHPLLERVAWSNLSFAWMYDENPQEALPCIQKALLFDVAHAGVPLMIQAEFASREAEILAMLGDRNACLDALAVAECEDGFDDTTTLPFGIHFDLARWAGYQGACFRRLSRQDTQEAGMFLTQAGQALQMALDHIPSTQLLRRSTLELDLAEVAFQTHELENALEHALQAAFITERTGSRMILQRLLMFRQQVGEVPLALRQSLDHQLTLLTSSPQTIEEEK